MAQPKSSLLNRLLGFLWDTWCIVSVIGIWPRFIEPRLIKVTPLTLQISPLSLSMEGLKIVQFSDLHIRSSMSETFLKKLIDKIKKETPDIIVFTGDFLCYGLMNDEERKRLLKFLNSFKAPYGCYAILGNHDYASFVSINSNGEYDISNSNQTTISRAFNRIFRSIQLKKTATPRARSVGFNESLLELLKQTPFELLHNHTRLIPIKDSYLNICGLGEYMLDKFQPQHAFQNYNPQYPGIILSHNPDTIPKLRDYPGNIILSGHTHGGQVNLPWLWKRFTLLENMEFKSGLVSSGNKWAYINRGVGAVLNFRWFAIPEILSLKLTQNDQRAIHKINKNEEPHSSSNELKEIS